MLPGKTDNIGRVYALTTPPPAGSPYMQGLPLSHIGQQYIDTGTPVDPSKTLDISFLNAGPLDSKITFTRSSTGTYLNQAGVLATAAINAPRFEYDSGGNPLGLLIEGARTNIFIQSDTPANQSCTVTAADWTLSFYGTGTIAYSGAATGSLVGTGAFPTRVSKTFTPTAGALALAITGTVTQVQLELGASASSYIPTTTAAATRAADNASMTGTNFSSWYNQTAGTFGVQFKKGVVLTNERVIAQDGAYTPMSIQSTYVQYYANPESVSSNTSIIANTVSKAASKYTNGPAGIIATCLNGTPVVSAVNNTTRSLTVLYVGNQLNSANYLFGHLQRLTYWNVAKSDAEMVSWTTLAITHIFPTEPTTDALLVSVGGTIASWNLGLPFTSGGRLIGTLDATPDVNDPYLAGVRVSPTTGVYFLSAAPPP